MTITPAAADLLKIDLILIFIALFSVVDLIIHAKRFRR